MHPQKTQKWLADAPKFLIEKQKLLFKKTRLRLWTEIIHIVIKITIKTTNRNF
jgi:hypothetical protein